MNAIAFEAPHDAGADGMAQSVRSKRAYAVAGRSTGSASPGAAVIVTRYTDTTLYDRMWKMAQLSDRQHQAAFRAGTLWHLAGLDGDVTADLGVVPDDVAMVEHPEHEAPLADDETAHDRYRAMMRQLSRGHADAIEALLGGARPGMSKLATCQSALDALADVLGLERIGVGF